jgi:hypothetical protein
LNPYPFLKISLENGEGEQLIHLSTRERKSFAYRRIKINNSIKIKSKTSDLLS